MPESVVVNDRNLYDEYGVHVRRGIDGGWPGRTPWSWQTQRPVGEFGAVRTATRPTVEPARLTSPLTMSADDLATMRTQVDAMLGALSLPKMLHTTDLEQFSDRAGDETLYFTNRADRMLMGRVIDVRGLPVAPDLTATWVDFELIFEAADPRWWSRTLQANVPVAPVHTLVLGNAPFSPVVRIQTPYVNPSLELIAFEDSTSSSNVVASIDFEIDSANVGDVRLEVDFEHEQATLNPGSLNEENGMPYWVPGETSFFWTVDPRLAASSAVTELRVRLTGDDVTGGATITYRPAYWNG